MGQISTRAKHNPPAPWLPFPRVLEMAPEALEDYYRRIQREGLTSLQLHLLRDHHDDLMRAFKRPDRHLLRARNSPGYALVRYLYSMTMLFIHTALSDLMAPLTDPITWASSVGAYIGIFLILTIMQTTFVLGYYLGAPRLLRYISHKYGQGQNLISWTNIAIPVLTGLPPVPYSGRDHLDVELLQNHDEDTAGREVLEFNVDVAKALVLMASMVYERDDEFVKLATQHPESGITYLLRSEELLYGSAKQWGLEFTSISDMETVSGPFIGAFYKIQDLQPHEHPFIVLVVKGTSPTSLAEWITDATLNLEDASDWLGAGQAHEGFYTSLFPPPSSSMSIMPYTRIINTIKLIAAQAQALPDRPRQPLNLFVAGHSLGAGIAQLLYARLLESPDDVGPGVALRDAYLFGAPRACGAELVSRIERALRMPRNFGCAVWRVANRDHSRVCGDIVTRVPPGLADHRHLRAKVKPGSLLSYGAIGIRIDLMPNASAPFYKMFAVPVGQVARVVKSSLDTTYGFQSYRQRSTYPYPGTIIQWLAYGATRLAPFLADHAPTEYYSSLCALQVRDIRNHQAIVPGKLALADMPDRMSLFTADESFHSTVEDGWEDQKHTSIHEADTLNSTTP